MDDFVYYSDDDVQVTSEAVVLGKGVYPLAAIKTVTIERKNVLPAKYNRYWQVGRWTLIALLFLFVVLDAVFQFIPPHLDSTVDLVLWGPVILLLWVIEGAIYLFGRPTFIVTLKTNGSSIQASPVKDVQRAVERLRAIDTALKDYKERSPQWTSQARR